MRVFHQASDRGYLPRHSFFNGRFVPYPEVPERIESILAALRKDRRFEIEAPGVLSEAALQDVHDAGYLTTLESVCGKLKEGEEFFPGVIQKAPLLLRSRYARVRAGYYTVDSSTPLLESSIDAARGAAATALSCAEAVASGERVVYGLMRPPGHHAGKDFWAGYCLINNAALAAARLVKLGKVAILDVDYHHGNGTQDIFYERDDVLYVSLHCRPEEAYPYIAGAAEESGSGRGRGFNRNFPLPGGTDWRAYAAALESALDAIRAFAPVCLVASLGFDGLEGDPIGTFRLRPEDFRAIGQRVAELGLPTAVIQEGGYLVPALGNSAIQFFDGLAVT
jgi:acetoin utilization deacetylase AcuC-like enzyme